jgi:hypothetical protein
MRAFYGVLKSVSQHIRFAFLTGVTKFAGVSIFSDLNMLRDISMDDKYGCICGVTESELEANFGPEIEALAAREGKSYAAMLAILREKYDGYRFTEDSERVYNPFSLLNVFNAKQIDYYWFETGTTTLLMKEMQRTYFDITRLDKGLYMEASDISDYRVGEDPIPLLYQSGYLTIESYDPESMRYKLCFPNTEVKQGFIKNLLRQYVPVNKRSEFDFNEFYADLAGGDLGEFMVRLESLFASAPYDLVGGWDRERFFQSFLYMLTTLLGCRTYAEYKSIRV